MTALCNALGGQGVRNKRAHDQAVQALCASLAEHARALRNGRCERPRTRHSTQEVLDEGTADAAAAQTQVQTPPLHPMCAALERDGVIPLTGEIVLQPRLLQRVQQACNEAREKGKRTRGVVVTQGVAVQAWAHERRTAIPVDVTEAEALGILSPALRAAAEALLQADAAGLKLLDSATVPVPPWAHQQIDHADHSKRREVRKSEAGLVGVRRQSGLIRD